ncbi:GNAT family N-acetyltransferase [Devosia sp. A8/3-2]|nr:GNAT family N-acetyltransferase [Devosia sp. A8/3-2]
MSQIPGAILLAIRPAERGDAQTLTTLMHQSSAYAGAYASILDGYAITPDQIDNDIFYVADLDAAIAGFYSLTLGDEPELDLMFIADHAQGTGLGAELFQHMTAEARRRGIASITIVSHPPSVGFYQRMGATIVGTKAPNMKARWERPILRLVISEPGVVSDASGKL